MQPDARSSPRLRRRLSAVDGSDWLALGSIAIAAAALGWTIARDKAGARAIAAERDERRTSLAREEGRRDEELRLLRFQVERQAESDAGRQTADLVGKNTGYSGSGLGVLFPISVRNVGAAAARDVRVWLALEAVDESPGTVVSGTHELGALVPNDPPAKFGLEQSGASAGGGVPRDGLIMAAWRDGSGDREESIGRLTVFL